MGGQVQSATKAPQAACVTEYEVFLGGNTEPQIQFSAPLRSELAPGSSLPSDKEATGDFSQSLVNFLPKWTARQRAFIWRFHRKTRSSYSRKEVHKLHRVPNILLHRSLTRQLFGSFPRHIDIYRRIKVLIWLSSGKSHVWHFHRVFTPRRPSPESRDPKKGKRNNLKYNRDPLFALKALLMNY